MVNVAFIGVGNRAGKYLSCLPADVKVAFLVDPNPIRLSQAAAMYGVPASACFSDTESFFSVRREVDGVIITTPDRLHHEQALAAIRAGYPVLLEKPATVSPEEFDDLLEESERTGAPVSVCLVMRYYPFCRRIKEIVESGEIGRILSIDHTESIGPDRMGHTFVRGLWSRKDLSGPIFLSKCSHDVDFLLWLTGGRALDVSSEGGLTKFNFDHAPAGAALRCLDCPPGLPLFRRQAVPRPAGLGGGIRRTRGKNTGRSHRGRTTDGSIRPLRLSLRQRRERPAGCPYPAGQ